MVSAQTWRRVSPRDFVSFRHHRGSAALLLVFALVLTLGVGGLAWYYLRKGTAEEAVPIVTSQVVLGPFEHVVLEQGTVESTGSFEIRCEVKSLSAGGTEILWVMDEGLHVKKGDKLVQLESSALEQDEVQQQIICNTAKAAVIQADNLLQAAEISRIEYLEGTFKQEEQVILSEIFVAEENLRRAQLAFQSTERLAAKGIVTSLQLEGDQFAVEKAKNELEAAKTKLVVIRKYTKEKMLKQFDSDIATSSAQWESEKESYKLELEKLLDIQLQIAHCTIVLGKKAVVVEEEGERRVEIVDDPEAPDEGQVVYANVYSRRGGSAEFVVEPGASVRERQALINLPDASKMQVKATINESRISLVGAGLRAEVTLDALKDRVLPGKVTKVNQYAEPGSWSSGNVKEYAAFIDILDPPEEIRSGMNAEVRIYVKRIPETLQVPVQTLYETKGHFFCLVKQGEEYETREVQVGVSNDSFMTIESGLDDGEILVMNPRAYPDKLEIPDLPDVEIEHPDSEEFVAAPQPSPGTGGPAAKEGNRGPGGAPGGESRLGARASRPPGGEQRQGGAPGGGPGGGNVDPAQRFAQLDVDGDGSLSSSELQVIPETFRGRMMSADADGDGAISREEFLSRGSERPGASGGSR